MFISRTRSILRIGSPVSCRVSRYVHFESSEFLSRYKWINRRYIHISRQCFKDDNPPDELNVPKAVASKFKLFKDESFLVMDVEEERRKKNETPNYVEEQDDYDEFQGINLQRGITGVFDIEEVVDILRKENAEGIFVAEVPKEFKYVDYLVIVSGRSQRHMLAIAEFIRRVYKRKRNPTDIIPMLEGSKSKDWMALDLGNIALHILSRSARKVYDLESLWAVGKEYDRLCNAPEDPIVTMLKEHSLYLGDLSPAEIKSESS